MMRTAHLNLCCAYSILFADMVGFTQWASSTAAPLVVELLNEVFDSFDVLARVCSPETILLPFGETSRCFTRINIRTNIFSLKVDLTALL